MELFFIPCSFLKEWKAYFSGLSFRSFSLLSRLTFHSRCCVGEYRFINRAYECLNKRWEITLRLISAELRYKEMCCARNADMIPDDITKTTRCCLSLSLIWRTLERRYNA